MSSASEPPEKCDQPVLLSGGVLRHYQLDGLHWLKVCVFSCIVVQFSLLSFCFYRYVSKQLLHCIRYASSKKGGGGEH